MLGSWEKGLRQCCTAQALAKAIDNINHQDAKYPLDRFIDDVYHLDCLD
jgi:hypothetical protein